MSDRDEDSFVDPTVDLAPSKPESTLTPTPPTEDELERFRQEWQQELQQRKRPGQQGSTTQDQLHVIRSKIGIATVRSDPNVTGSKATESGRGQSSDFDRGIRDESPITKSPSTSPKASHKVPVGQSNNKSRIEPSAGPSNISAVAGPSVAKPSKELKGKRAQKVVQAVEQYANAVELEQMGRLNEALQLYRGAYKLDREPA
jgi:hypothetical protein